MRGELAGGVWVEPGEGHHRPASDAAGDVLERRGVRAATLELLAHEPLVVGGLVEVLAEGGREPALPGEHWRRLHLRQCLHLDRVHVGEVPGQLVFDRALSHRVSALPV